MSLEELESVSSTIDDYCEEFLLIDPAKPKKQRTVLSVRGKLRTLQTRLLQHVLIPAFTPSPYSHGGVAGRSIKTNVEPHLGSIYALTTDVSNFYPSIHYKRVYRLFCGHGCSPDVSRLCTMLTTWRFHLSLGLVTSPIIADQVFLSIDERIAAACARMGLVYTRFVDDISISGTFDLSPRRCGIARMVERIIDEHGFASHKDFHGRLDKGVCLTKLRVRNGRIDVRSEYAMELDRQLEDAASLARDEAFAGPFFTQAQIRGRMHFVKWINAGRWGYFWKRFRTVDWNSHFNNGKRRGLVIARKELTPILKSTGL